MNYHLNASKQLPCDTNFSGILIFEFPQTFPPQKYTSLFTFPSTYRELVMENHTYHQSSVLMVDNECKSESDSEDHSEDKVEYRNMEKKVPVITPLPGQSATLIVTE